MSAKLAVCVAVLAISIVASSQAQCPAGLIFVGRLHADSGGGREIKQHNVTTVFPRKFKLDRSSQQTSLVAAGGGASSDMTAARVPSGLYILPGGDKEWAVSEPELGAAEIADDMIVRYKYSMYLYCATGDSVLNRTKGGCNVHVDVCAKARAAK